MVCVFGINTVNAESLNQENSIAYSGNGYFLKSIMDTEGNYIAVGYDNTDKSSSFGLIVKYDEAGNTIWEKKIADVGTVRAVDVDKDSNIYVLIWYWEIFSDERVQKTNNNAVKLVKYNKDGEQIYEKNLIDQYDTQFFEYLEVYDDKIYITGEVLTDKTFVEDDGSYYIYEVSERNSFITLDLDGNILSTNIYGSYRVSKRYHSYSVSSGATISGLAIRLYDMEIDKDGNIYVCNANGDDFEVAKFNKNGEKLWDKSYGGSGNDTSYNLTLSENNEVIVVGYTSSSDLDGIELGSKYSVPLVVILSDSGEEKKMFTINNVGTIYSIVTIGNEYFIAHKSSYYYVLTKLDNEFNIKYSKSLSGEISFYDLNLNDDNTINISGKNSASKSGFVRYSLLYDLDIADSNGGKVTIENDTYKEGEMVTIKVKPEDGYVLGAIGGIEVSKVDDETYTFIMPSSDVTLTPEFVMADAINKSEAPSDEKSEESVQNPETGGFVGVMVSIFGVIVSILILIGVLLFKHGKNRKIYKI